MSSRCPYFKLLFESNFKESTQKDIYLKDISVFYFSVIYNYLISGELCLEDKEARYLIDLMKCANYFMLDEVASLC